ncbi:uncharacterized protein LOC131068635 [Cryptomeria japonica]|uniref:uncharacterized protein LOC131068635 n=1 Tax=Cryptomeria japonica TaxID=3369 RepID=UPI0027DA82D2|nr:uncharacterized protein LOC131068635 [Cryptomeria japonica]
MDYKALVNTLQRHTKCTKSTCLRKKGHSLQCRCKASWPEQEKSTLALDSDTNPCYTTARNDDCLNIHNPCMLSIRRANMDCQPVTSRKVVLQYISKYASKSEKRSEYYTEMLKTIVNASESKDVVLSTYHKFMMHIIAYRDINAQETCHMLQKISLINCSCQFLSLNVSKKPLHDITKSNHETNLPRSYIHAYMQRPSGLNTTTLLQSAQDFSYVPQRKKEKWQLREQKAIVNVYPHFPEPLIEDSDEFDLFCWFEFLLYKPFRDMATKIGTSKDQVIANWKDFSSNGYVRLYDTHLMHALPPQDADDSDDNDWEHQEESNLYEWQFISQMGATNQSTKNELQMLGRRDYDISYSWPTNIANEQLESNATQFISASKSQFHPPPIQVPFIDSEKFHLSSQQKLALDIILQHHSQQAGTIPLRMIVQGTSGTRKSFLIHCIRQNLNVSTRIQGNPLLVLAPIGVAAYNIQGTTLHAGL